MKSSDEPTRTVEAFAPSSDRADRLLRAMHKVFSHDLPNQLVVVQSLAGLMELEESDRLSPQAREYLGRLTGATQRAGKLVHFLKQMARLNTLDEPVELVYLDHLAHELQAELHQSFPDHVLAFEIQWNVPVIAAGRRSLHQALLEILRCGIDCCRTRAPRVRLHSKPHEGAAVLDLRVSCVGNSPLLAAAPIRHDRAASENRIELVLARELLANWGAVLEPPASAENVVAFRILFPAAESAGRS